VEVVVGPTALRESRQAANGTRERRDLTGGTDGDLLAVRHAEVEQLRIDLRRGGGDVRRESRRGKKLSIDEACMVDGKEHSAEASGLQHLDVDPFRKHGDLSATDEPFL